MDVRLSELEAWMSRHEGTVEHDLAHSGVAPALDYGTLPADRDLVRLVAERHGVAPEEVVVANGASEAAFLAAVAVVRPGDEVAIETPTYPPLAQGPEILGARVRRFPRRFDDGFAAPVAPVRDARLTVYSSPHNPSGRRVPAPVIAETAEATRGYVLVDEVFREIAEDPPPTGRRAHPRALATGSLTKAHGLPGLRVGWLLAPPDVAERARAAKNVVSMSTGAIDQALAVRALEAGPARRAIEARRANLPLVEATLREMRLRWVHPEAGVTCVVEVQEDDRKVAEALLAAGVLVVPGSAVGAPGTLRLGFGGTRKATEAALAAFRRAFPRPP